MGFLLPVRNMKPPFDIAADLDTPVSAYLKLAPFRPRFLLESVEGGERLARYSFIGFGDCLEVKLEAKGLCVDGLWSPRPKSKSEFLSKLREALARTPQPQPNVPGCLYPAAWWAIPPMTPFATSSAYRPAASMKPRPRMRITSHRAPFWYSTI